MPNTRHVRRRAVRPLADSAAASTATTASSRARRTSGTPTSSWATSACSRRRRPRRATTSPRTSSTGRSPSSRTRSRVEPEKPFFLYLAFGATHAPHHVPKPYIEKYRGRFDDGWDAVRERTYARQKQMGIVPPGTELAPRNDGVRAWDDLNDNEKRWFARTQEVFAGLPGPHRRADRAAARLPRWHGADREHPDRPDLRQRRQPGGRSDRQRRSTSTSTRSRRRAST